MELQQRHDELLSQILQLPARQRGILLARYGLGLSTKETAERFSCAVGTIKATLHQTIRRLRTRNAERTDE
jgi:RNA polymerase sigma factor (sigma-70 family)